jgi:hypothetical protein
MCPLRLAGKIESNMLMVLEVFRVFRAHFAPKCSVNGEYSVESLYKLKGKKKGKNPSRKLATKL